MFAIDILVILQTRHLSLDLIKTCFQIAPGSSGGREEIPGVRSQALAQSRRHNGKYRAYTHKYQYLVTTLTP